MDPGAKKIVKSFFGKTDGWITMLKIFGKSLFEDMKN